jgi:glycerophosphoryl diester phosphodiesterase
MPRSTGPNQTIGFAHRGARAERRENTLDAFSRALELGANGLESDAWLTADGVVVLDHDGVTGSRWRRRAVSAQDRADLPPHIPALSDLYERCGSAYELSLDVKDPAALADIVAVASAAGAVDRLWLCYHDWRIMAGWKAVAGPAHLVESTNVHWISEGLDARLEALGDAGIDAINLPGAQWDARMVEQVHQAGRRAFGWNAQSTEQIRRLVDLGLDGIYSDHVDRLMAVIGSA